MDDFLLVPIRLGALCLTDMKSALCRWPKVFSQIAWASITAEALRPRRLRREE